MKKSASILYVDLSVKSVSTETLSADIYRKYPGGSALGMYLLFKEMGSKTGVDPLSPENPLIFSVSPLTGIPISGQSRMNVTAKSPLTGTAGDSQVGGYIPAHIKGNGYDAIVIKGKSDTPAYLFIDKETVEIKDASPMWGMVTGDAEDFLIKDLGTDKIESSIIGPAGENQVLFSSIMHQRSRANGRNGLGAVMGSKNFKALVVKKQPPARPEDQQGMKTLTLDVKERMGANESIVDLSLNGSAGCLMPLADEGFLASYNWNSGVLEGADKISGDTMRETVLVGRETCFGCAIRCKRVVDIPGKAEPKYGGPEYETLATFGSYCGSNNLADVCQANQLCNMYGLDTISCGATIAWAMDCYEKGILTKEDTDGLELSFGNSSVYAELVPKIARREKGIGALLSLGSKRAAQLIGKGAEELVVTSKGQEWPAHMVQMKSNLAINYSVNNFGADHQSSEHDPALMAPEDDQNWIWPNMLADFEKCEDYGVLDDNKVKFAFETQKFYSMMDTLMLCQFVWGPAWQLYGPEDLLKFCKYGIGWEATLEELQEIGERRINMMRMFNIREGFSREDDVLPPKAFLPMPEGPNEGTGINKEDFDKALDAYYDLAGWDRDTASPKQETIKRLGLEWISELQ